MIYKDATEISKEAGYSKQYIHWLINSGKVKVINTGTDWNLNKVLFTPFQEQALLDYIAENKKTYNQAASL